MRIRLAYSSRGYPIEVEIEGSALTPDTIPSVLGSTLKQLEEWLDTIVYKKTMKTRGEKAPETPNAPTQANGRERLDDRAFPHEAAGSAPTLGAS